MDQPFAEPQTAPLPVVLPIATARMRQAVLVDLRLAETFLLAAVGDCRDAETNRRLTDLHFAVSLERFGWEMKKV